MIQRVLTIAAVAAALAATGVVAAPMHGMQMGKDSAKAKAPIICPVMKGTIESPAKAAGHSVYHGKTYYFCCSGCKPKFDKDPTRYVCPVTGNILPKNPTVKTTYEGKTYYFCCADCKPKFDKNPAKYLKR